MTVSRGFHNPNDPEQGIGRDLAPGPAARLFPGENGVLSVVSFAPDTAGAIHGHPEEQSGVLLEGGGTRTQDGEEIPVRAGDFWRTPGTAPHGFTAGAEGAGFSAG